MATPEARPVIDYLLKEVSFSTCDNRFFGDLEKEMLIPNNLNIYGRISGATSLHGYRLRAEFPEDIVLAYLKRPLSSAIENGKRVLNYALDDLVNYDTYWWLPLRGLTEFVLPLNLLPPFPQLNPVDMSISCRPDVAVGVETSVTTTVNIEAEENIDNLFLTFSAPPFGGPGVSMSISEYSGDDISEPRQLVTSPKKEYPFPKLSLKPGQSQEYTIKTKIVADLTSMTSLKCQQDILRTRLIALSESTESSLPCAVSISDDKGRQVQVDRTERCTILQAQAQIMYSPFSIRRDKPAQPERKLVETPAV